MAGLVLVAVLLWVAAYRVLDPPGGLYMAREAARLGGLRHEWVGLADISPALVQAVIAAEDARFCRHAGLDFEAIRAAWQANAEGGTLRGGSTLTQQVAKNVFLWPERSWLRKGLEAGFALAVEALWPKARIIEVYLNVAEFDTGVFGAEAAARHHFGVGAAGLNASQAARLAAVLPDPKGRSAVRPSAATARRVQRIAEGARVIAAQGGAGCISERFQRSGTSD
ncbi:MAG: monofunctional biosynthetic peptidoglycan transglycosylase [Pseudomonadota bacterium]